MLSADPDDYADSTDGSSESHETDREREEDREFERQSEREEWAEVEQTIDGGIREVEQTVDGGIRASIVQFVEEAEELEIGGEFWEGDDDDDDDEDDNDEEEDPETEIALHWLADTNNADGIIDHEWDSERAAGIEQSMTNEIQKELGNDLLLDLLFSVTEAQVAWSLPSEMFKDESITLLGLVLGQSSNKDLAETMLSLAVSRGQNSPSKSPGNHGSSAYSHCPSHQESKAALAQAPSIVRPALTIAQTSPTGQSEAQWQHHAGKELQYCRDLDEQQKHPNWEERGSVTQQQVEELLKMMDSYEEVHGHQEVHQSSRHQEEHEKDQYPQQKHKQQQEHLPFITSSGSSSSAGVPLENCRSPVNSRNDQHIQSAVKPHSISLDENSHVKDGKRNEHDQWASRGRGGISSQHEKSTPSNGKPMTGSLGDLGGLGGSCRQQSRSLSPPSEQLPSKEVLELRDEMVRQNCLLQDRCRIIEDMHKQVSEQAKGIQELRKEVADLNQVRSPATMLQSPVSHHGIYADDGEAAYGLTSPFLSPEEKEDACQMLGMQELRIDEAFLSLRALRDRLSLGRFMDIRDELEEHGEVTDELWQPPVPEALPNPSKLSPKHSVQQSPKHSFQQGAGKQTWSMQGSGEAWIPLQAEMHQGEVEKKVSNGASDEVLLASVASTIVYSPLSKARDSPQWLEVTGEKDSADNGSVTTATTPKCDKSALWPPPRPVGASTTPQTASSGVTSCSSPSLPISSSVIGAGSPQRPISYPGPGHVQAWPTTVRNLEYSPTNFQASRWHSPQGTALSSVSPPHQEALSISPSWPKPVQTSPSFQQLQQGGISPERGYRSSLPLTSFVPNGHPMQTFSSELFPKPSLCHESRHAHDIDQPRRSGSPGQTANAVIAPASGAGVPSSEARWCCGRFLK